MGISQYVKKTLMQKGVFFKEKSDSEEPLCV